MRTKRVFRAGLIVAPLILSACELTDFRKQPSVAPWQSLKVDWSDTTTPSRGNPQGSVPTTGMVVARYEVSYGIEPATIDSMSSFKNPEAPTQESVDRGWKYFQTTCAACHGPSGAAEGPLTKPPFFITAPSLLLPVTLARTDGYIFGMIRNGRGAMPTMDRIPEEDRWHIVNYLRGLQGRLPPNIIVRKEMPGRPGVTGDSLPGPTKMGPTRPIPFVKPVYVATPKAGGR